MKVIRSRDNPTFKRLVRLSGSSRERKLTGATLLDGAHLIEAYQAAGLRDLHTLAASESAMARDSVKQLMRDVEAGERLCIEDRLFDQISQVVTPSGVLAVISTPAAPTLPPKIDDAIYLEGIQDPGNMGSIFRSALATGVTRVLLSPQCVFAWAPKVVRAGMGAHFHLTIHEAVTLDDLGDRVTGKRLATASRASLRVDECDLSGGNLWIFGNEGAGISPEAKAFANESVRIPMGPHSESFNVAAAAAICLYEQDRQRRMKVSKPGARA
jgi:RNA methyltransferase, TrmH family